MRKQKRYTTEKQILDAIDSKVSLASQCLNDAIAQDKIADSARELIASIQGMEETRKIQETIFAATTTMEEARTKAIKLSKLRNRIEQVQLPKLKQALAAFRTPTMEAITTDLAVVA